MQVSIVNAVRQALAYAGSDWQDISDMIVSLAPWKKVALGVKKATEHWREVLYFASVDPNFVTQPVCRPVLHKFQVASKVLHVRSRKDLERFERSSGFVHVNLVNNRHPRKVTDTLSVITFRFIGANEKVGVIFPQDDDQSMVSETLGFLSKHTVVTRGVKMVKSVFRLQGHFLKEIRDVTATSLTFAQGRSHDVVCNYVWGHRFCQITDSEWYVPLLSESQEYHMAYFMEMTEAFINKVGLNSFRRTK